MKENMSIMKNEGENGYGSMLLSIKVEDGNKGAMSLLQESDLRYLVDIVWARKSAISGTRNLEDLTLTKWDIHEPLAPWNCILLTKQEAMSHQAQKSYSVYSVEFKTRIFQKLVLARQHFGKLPLMEQYFNEQNEKAAEDQVHGLVANHSLVV